MADVAESLSSLHDIRLPGLGPEALLGDVAVTFAAGLALALIATQLARLFLYRPASRCQRLLEALFDSRQLPAGERLLAQARLLKRLADELAQEPARDDWLTLLDRRLGTDFFTVGPGAQLRDGLYRREPPVDPEVIEREVVRLLRRARI